MPSEILNDPVDAGLDDTPPDLTGIASMLQQFAPPATPGSPIDSQPLSLPEISELVMEAGHE